MATPLSRPSFHSADLRAALDQAAPHIEAFTATLDQVSEDIKQLEEYLDRSGVRVAASAEISLGTPEPGVTEALHWDVVDESRRWRVMYDRRGPGDKHERRPLIEAPAEVRLDAYLALPELLRNVADRVTIARPEDGIE